MSESSEDSRVSNETRTHIRAIFKPLRFVFRFPACLSRFMDSVLGGIHRAEPQAGIPLIGGIREAGHPDDVDRDVQ